MRRAALAVMTRPDSANAHLEMGQLCRARGMSGRAVLSLERALALDPQLTSARSELAALHRELASGHPTVATPAESEFLDR
jgi:hypothetical protein